MKLIEFVLKKLSLQKKAGKFILKVIKVIQNGVKIKDG